MSDYEIKLDNLEFVDDSDGSNKKALLTYMNNLPESKRKELLKSQEAGKQSAEKMLKIFLKKKIKFEVI